MFKYWKKSLVAAGVLATVLAGSAFAATEAEDAATQQRGLDYNNRIEQQAPDMEKGQPPFLSRLLNGRNDQTPDGCRHHDTGRKAVQRPLDAELEIIPEKEDACRPGRRTEERDQ